MLEFNLAPNRGGGCHLRSVVAWCCLSLLWACLATPAFAAAPRFAFTANGLDFSLSSYRVLETGELRHLGHRPIDKASSDIVVHPSGQFVLVVSKTMSTIAVYRLDRKKGELTPVEGSPFRAEATSPFRLAIHPSGRFVYAAARFSGVAAYAFDLQSGALTPLPGSPFLAQERTRSVAMHPSGRFLYAVNGYSNSISAYTVDQETGALREMPASPYSSGDMGEIDYRALFMADVPAGAGGIPHDIVLDPQGRFAFVANWADASVSVFRINADNGQLTAIDGSPFFTGFNPYAMSVHPNGKFLYVAQYSSSEIAVHAIDASSGRLTPVAGSPFSSGSLGPVALTFNVAGNQLYVMNYEGNDVALMDVDVSSGALALREVLKTRSGPWSMALVEGDDLTNMAPVAVDRDGLKASLPSVPGFTADAVAVRPGGLFVYAIDRNRGRLATFAINPATGEARVLADAELPTGVAPVDLDIDVNGWYLYVTNGGDNTLSVYVLGVDDGIPQPVRGSPVATGERPASLTLGPAARYAFVANAAANTVSVYRYMNGLTPLIFESRKYGSPFATGKQPVAIAVAPTGEYAYVANAGSNDISAYRIHAKTGALSALPGSPFKTATQPVDVQAHPSGRWLYVANQGASKLSIYAIEKGLGALAAGGREVKLPVRPKALRLDSKGETLWVLSENGLRLLRLAVDGNTGGLTLLKVEALKSPVADLDFVTGAGSP